MQRVERLHVGPVLRAVVVRIGLRVDQPPVVAGVPLGPPAVADRHVRRAVHRRLHAARAAGLERFARVVHPDVAALDQEMGHVQVVILDEGDPAAELRIEGAAIDPLQVMLADVVGRDAPCRRTRAAPGAPAG